MIRVAFAPSFSKHVQTDNPLVSATCVAIALEQVFDQYPTLRGYVLDDQGAVRKHVTIFVNDHTIRDRVGLQDRLDDGDEVFVFQALSGG
ncbi:MAG: MoaD/ThiS family protein [Pirellulaceae bacterium]|nr:MoaD/ThiS family protein [Pirellulaceae bacterium]